MSYKLTSEKKDDILWVTATGTRSPETILAVTKDIFKVCAEKKVTKVLVDVRAMKNHLKPFEAHFIVDKHFDKMRDRRLITKVALVDLKESANWFRFFETVAVNRGLNLRVFLDSEQAIDWLKE